MVIHPICGVQCTLFNVHAGGSTGDSPAMRLIPLEEPLSNFERCSIRR